MNFNKLLTGFASPHFKAEAYAQYIDTKSRLSSSIIDFFNAVCEQAEDDAASIQEEYGFIAPAYFAQKYGGTADDWQLGSLVIRDSKSSPRATEELLDLVFDRIIHSILSLDVDLKDWNEQAYVQTPRGSILMKELTSILYLTSFVELFYDDPIEYTYDILVDGGWSRFTASDTFIPVAVSDGPLIISRPPNFCFTQGQTIFYNYLSSYSYPLDEFFEDFISSTASCAAASIACQAFNFTSDIVSRVQYLSQKLNSVYATGLISNLDLVDQYTSLLALNDVSQFAQALYEQTGLSSLAEEVFTSGNLNDNIDMNQFSGVSPRDALCCDLGPVAGAIQATAKATGAVLKGVASMIGSTIRKGVEILNQVTTDPYDVKEVDGNYPVLCDFASHQSWVVARQDLDSGVLTSDFPKELFFDFIFGYSHATRTQLTDSLVTYDVRFKPYPIDLDTCRLLYDKLEPLAKRDVYQVSELVEAFESFSSVANPTYLSTKDSEKALFAGFARSLYMSSILDEAARVIEQASSPSQYVNEFQMKSLRGNNLMNLVIDENVYSSVTNRDFIKLCASWDPVINQFGNYGSQEADEYFSFDAQHIPTIVGASVTIFDGYVAAKIEQRADPLNFQFYPYLEGIMKELSGKFIIKTDAENSKAFELLVTAIVAAATVLIVGGGLKITRKVMLKKKRLKLQTQSAKLQKEINNFPMKRGRKGASGTPDEQLQRIIKKKNKIDRKMDRVNKRLSGFAPMPALSNGAGGDNVAASVQENISLISQLIR